MNYMYLGGGMAAFSRWEAIQMPPKLHIYMQTYIIVLTFLGKVASEYHSDRVKGVLKSFFFRQFSHSKPSLSSTFPHCRIPVLEPQEEEEQRGTIFLRKKNVQPGFICSEQQLSEATFHFSRLMVQS